MTPAYSVCELCRCGVGETHQGHITEHPGICCACHEWRVRGNPVRDPVNHPPHYNAGKIEVISVIEDWKLGFHEGNAVKYILRAAHKGNRLQDLQKARWYLDRLIANLTAPADPGTTPRKEGAKE